MKYRLVLLVAISIPLGFLAQQVLAAAPTVVSAQAVQASSPVVLCLPGIYLDYTNHCTPTGPSIYLSQLARQGILLPLPPLPITATDPALGKVDVHYGEVRNNNAPVYASLDDAIKARPKLAIRRLTGSFMYISYTDEQVINNKRYYMIEQGAWMTANDISRIGVLPASQGVTLDHNPTNAFGWVLTYWISEPLQTKRTPGLENQDYTGHVLKLYDIVPVFAEQQVGSDVWYMIAPEEWVLQKYIARVTPEPTPPEGVTGGRWIAVNLFEQTLAVYDNYQMVFATLIASGAKDTWTRPGLFQINQKLENTPMTGASTPDRSDAYYLEDVPWTMYYDGPRALHGAYWRAKMGFPQSHGCINMTVGDAHWLFNWAHEGDWVFVWDPTGQTPTDPSLYGPGGY
jgi:lipoprotein-anchoring transpeptidase ErfK/SrfK